MKSYLHEDIAPLFGTTFNPGNWNAGIVRLGNDLILLATLNGDTATGRAGFSNRFPGAEALQWQSQNQTRRESQVGQMIGQAGAKARVHLFVRSGRLRNGKAAPFFTADVPPLSAGKPRPGFVAEAAALQKQIPQEYKGSDPTPRDHAQCADPIPTQPPHPTLKSLPYARRSQQPSPATSGLLPRARTK
ncbi:DUF3427 domain-containing protein [Gemmobacter lanyuensis]